MNDYFAIIGYVSTIALIVYFIRTLVSRRKKGLPLLASSGRRRRKSQDEVYEYQEFQTESDLKGQESEEGTDEETFPHQLSDLQVQKLSYLFMLLDFNHNGSIQRDDFMNIAENMTIIKAATMEDVDANSIRKLMEMVWINLSGMETDPKYKIDLNRWLHFASHLIVNCPEETYSRNIDGIVKFIFKYFDDNNDQELNFNEYMSMLVSFRAEFRSARKSFDLMDTNGDNVISIEELSQSVREFFKSSDANSPGNWLFGDWEVPTFNKGKLIG